MTETGDSGGESAKVPWINTLPDGSAGGIGPTARCQNWTSDSRDDSGNIGMTIFYDKSREGVRPDTLR